MVNIVISGVPKNLKYTKLLMHLRDTEGVGYVKQLYWKPLDGNTKQIVLAAKVDDVCKLLRGLDGYVVKYNGEDYPLSCWQVERNERERNQPRSRSREHSPISRNHQFEPEMPNLPRQENYMDDEIRALDLQIELVKKRRILVEEEARLRVEQQKLELLKTLGRYDHEKLKKFEKIKDLNDPKQLAELAISTGMAVKPEPTVRVFDRKLPAFVEYLKTVLVNMKGVVKKHLTNENKKVLRSVVRIMVKDRIRKILKDKHNIRKPEEFFELYRSIYPADTDDALLQEANSRIYAPLKVDQDRQLGNTKAGDIKVTSVMDPDEVDIVDMENDLDDWNEVEKTQIEGANGITPKEEGKAAAVVEEANNDVAVVEEASKDVAVVEEANKDVAVVEEANNDVAVVEEANKDVAVVEEANNDGTVAGEAEEAEKEVKQDDKAFKEDTVKEDEDVTIVDDNKVDKELAVVNDNEDVIFVDNNKVDGNITIVNENKQ